MEQLNRQEQAILNEMSGDVIYTFAQISEWTKIPVQTVRAILRDFRRRGLAEYGVSWSEDDYCVKGSGYWLTDSGWSLKTGEEPPE